ncbi:hypothetical protein [Neobacillus sp. LXY-4]|uniref:hypothetical protein n=1 Tax=Neobacillus sp. LXY-4 TaxID=3379826 RepID=UPI003EE1DA37
MDLFEEIVINDIEQDPIIKIRENNEQPKVVYEKLEIDEFSGQEIPSISQYLLAPFILVSSNGMLEIPIDDDKTLDIATKEIAPHFNKVVKITTDEKQVGIRLQNVRESSKIHFMNLKENRKVNAIVNDIYSEGTSSWGETFAAKEFRVNLDLVRKTTNHDILSMWDFFEHTFVQAYGGMAIIPSGWSFDESFKERVAVQSFASVCNEMIVTVNSENNMITSVLIS